MKVRKEQIYTKRKSCNNSDFRPLNSTETLIESKKIRITLQKSIFDEESDKHSKYQSLLLDKLSSIFQNSEYCRRQAADGLLKLLRSNPDIIYENIDKVINIISTCWVDKDVQVRKSVYKITLELFEYSDISPLSPFSDFIYMQIKNTLSHIRSDVRIDGLTFLNKYLLLDFGNHKELFINLKYIVGLSPFVCRIASTDFSRTLNEMYIIISTIREMTYQITLNTKINNRSLLYTNLSSLQDAIVQLFDSLCSISFEIISRREQKYQDNISISFLKTSTDKKNIYEKNCVKIKRASIPNIPLFIPNERDSILSLLNSMVMDTLYYISILDFCNIPSYVKIEKILNSLNELNIDSTVNFGTEGRETVMLIEHLSRFKLLSSYLTRIKNIRNIEIINEFVNMFHYFIKNYTDFKNPDKNTLSKENQSSIFHFAFLNGIQILNINAEINSIREFFTPKKYILFALLNSFLDLEGLVSILKNSSYYNNFEIKNPFTDRELTEMNNYLCKLSINIDMSHNIIKIDDLTQILLTPIIMKDQEFTKRKRESTSFMFNTLVLLPIVMNRIGYKQKYYIDRRCINWNVMEGIMFYISSRCKKITKRSDPTKNELLQAKFCVSKLPKLVYMLFNYSKTKKKNPPVNIIYNLLVIIYDFLSNNMLTSIRDETLFHNVSKGLMSLFILSTEFSNKEQCNIISCMPFQIQKKIISVIPNLKVIPSKFVYLLLKELLYLIKKKKVLFSLLIIKTLISGTSDTILPLEMKLSIVRTILNDCECSTILKFQLFSTISESLIILLGTHFLVQFKKQDIPYLFFKFWFTPLTNKTNTANNSMNFKENVLIFLIMTTSKFFNFYKELPIEEHNTLYELRLPEAIKNIIFNSITNFFDINYPLNNTETEEITLIYNELISDYLKLEKKHDIIKDVFPIEKLKQPIYYIMLTFRSSSFLSNDVDIFNSKTLRFNSVASIINYSFERYLLENIDKKSDENCHNIFTFGIISLWWLTLSKDLSSLRIIRKNVFKLIIDFFKTNDKNEYNLILNHIKYKIQRFQNDIITN